MTDIDFDELDKAVNSALKPALEDHKQPEAPAATPATPSPVDAPKGEDTLKSAAVPTISIKPRTGAPLTLPSDRQDAGSPAIKRSGRFMDMVHPSSDMANEKKLAPAAKVKIVPTENAPKPDEKPEEPASVEEAVKPEDFAQPEKSTEMSPDADTLKQLDDLESGVASEPEESIEEIVKPQYPDPIDVAGPLSIAEEPIAPVTAGVEEATPEASAPEAPFIPDAKVEKRPLGGFSPEETVPEVHEADEESQLPPETSLPAALQSDVVAVESDVLPDVIPGQQDDEYEDSKSEKHEVSDDKETKPDAPKHAAESTADHGVAQSIPQQYHSAPAKADEDAKPVFDTDQYHQPLIAAHTGKKSHVWVFVLLILALLAVGGTLGYFAFMSGL